MDELKKKSPASEDVMFIKKFWGLGCSSQRGVRRVLENSIDHYTVLVVKNVTIVGHLLCKISRIYTLIIRRGVVTCEAGSQ